MRPSKRAADEMRNIKITRNFTKHAEGSVLVEFGDTKVVCTASVEDRRPRPNLSGPYVDSGITKGSGVFGAHSVAQP